MAIAGAKHTRIPDSRRNHPGNPSVAGTGRVRRHLREDAAADTFRMRSMARQFLLELKLTLLEGLDHHGVRHRAAQLVMKLSFKTGMFELQRADVWSIHGQFSSSPGGGPHPIQPSNGLKAGKPDDRMFFSLP
jgi:hypothetical protein